MCQLHRGGGAGKPHPQHPSILLCRLTHLVRPDLPPDARLLEDVHALRRQRHGEAADHPVGSRRTGVVGCG